MAELTTYFNDFLRSIRLTPNQIDDCKKGHETLRKRLCEDQDLKSIIVSDFIQGSYRRSTAVRPLGDCRSDVDVIIVTRMDKDSTTPEKALEMFRGFLEKWYKGKYEKQGRSWGIELSYVELDLVPTAAPSEVIEKMVRTSSVSNNIPIEESVEWPLRKDWDQFGNRNSFGQKSLSQSVEWKSEPLWIPDRNAAIWDKTDPLTQIFKTQHKNKVCNGHFVNVVKCLKWWRKAIKPVPKYPKSYPLEHLIFLNCPDGISSVAQGIVQTLEAIRDKYWAEAAMKKTPFISDHGVPEHNVFERLTGDDFAQFHFLVSDAADIARKAFDSSDVDQSVECWKKLFGDKFPSSSGNAKNLNEVGGFTPRIENTVVYGGIFA